MWPMTDCRRPSSVAGNRQNGLLGDVEQPLNDAAYEQARNLGMAAGSCDDQVRIRLLGDLRDRAGDLRSPGDHLTDLDPCLDPLRGEVLDEGLNLRPDTFLLDVYRGSGPGPHPFVDVGDHDPRIALSREPD